MKSEAGRKSELMKAGMRRPHLVALVTRRSITNLKSMLLIAVTLAMANFATGGQIADNWQFPLVDRDWFDTANRQGYSFGQLVSGSYHLGEDIWRDYEAPVYACANGIVKCAQYVTFGAYQVPVVVIEHDLGGGVFVCSVYYHIQYSAYVSVGQQVSKGSQIGYVSLVNSDHANTTPHLHFGIRNGSFTFDHESDGYWRYKGYGSSTVLGSWYSPSYFIGRSLIIDEHTAFCSTQGSSWTDYSSSSVGWSQHLLWTYAWDGAAPDCWARWNLNGVGDYMAGRFLAGQYEVSVFVPNNYATSLQAQYEIHHGLAVSYATVDQNAYANAWVSLGTYDFASSGDQYVRLNDNTGEAYSLQRMIACDAVRLTYVGGTPPDTTPPTISAFNVTPTSTTVGSPVTITYTASDSGGSGLKTAQLWRTPDDGYGVPNPNSWQQIGPSIDISTAGNGPYQGSFSDTPPLVGTWWYGVHAVNNASKWSVEPNPPGPKQVTVTQPAGTLQFAQPNYSLNENGGTVSLSVTRAGGSSGAVSVQYATANGTAVAPGDYTSTSGTLTWGSGDTASKTITATIVNDSTVENSESFTVTLSNPTGGATLGSPTVATVTILDDEPQPAGKLWFDQASHSVGEGGGEAVGVRRTGGSSGAVSVQYATADGTAVAPGDYTAISGTLTWSSGDAASKYIPVNTVNDSTVECDESFTITLFNPTGGTVLGSITTTTVTILEDDGPPPPPTAKPATSVTSTGFVANWSYAPGVTGYYFELDVSTSSTFSDYADYNYKARVAEVLLNWPMTGLNPGTTYYYRVRAYNRVGTSGNSGTISLTTAAISVTPASQDFGSIQMGTTADRTFTVQNTGGGTLSGSASVWVPFLIEPGGSYSLGPGASQTVTVRYSPTSAGTDNQTVTFTGGGGATCSVTGSATATRIISLSGNLAFGSVAVGSSAQSSFTIYNTGNSALTVSNINYPSGFNGNWSGTIAAGGSQPVIVTFSPTSAANYNGTVTVNSDMTGGTNIKAISGTGTLPILGTAKQNSNIVLSWPTNATGYTLQSTTNLGSTAVWSTVSPPPVGVSGQNVVTNSITGQRKFYRLMHP